MKLLSAALTALLISGAALAAEPAGYARYAMRLPARLVNVAAEDLDGDGLKDIAAFSVKADNHSVPARHVSVFYQRRGSGFPSEPDQTWALDKDASVFDVGNVPGNKKAVAFLAPDGLWAYMPNGRQYSVKPVQLISAEDVFTQPDPRDIPRWPIFTDSAGGIADIALVPRVDRLLVYQPTGNAYRQVNSLPLYTQTSFSEGFGNWLAAPLTVSHRIPSVTSLGFNDKTGQDLFITWDDNADVWLKKPSGGYADQPALRFRPGLLDVSKKDDGSFDSASVQAMDLAGDGRRDLVVTKMTGGVAQTKSLVFIYMRQDGGGFPAKPNQTIITEGLVGPRIIDVNGDGRLDILLPSIKMGISNFINMLTSKQVNMDIGIYLQDKNGRYPDRPTKVKGVSFKLDISNLGKNARPVMGMGRFSRTPGYGLAVVSGEDRVSVFLPDRYSVLGDNPGLKLKVDAPTEMDVLDLDGDGVDDLLMTYKKTKDNDRTINVFISK